MRTSRYPFVFPIFYSRCSGGLQAQGALPNLFISDGDNVDLFNGASLNTSFITPRWTSRRLGPAFGPNGTPARGQPR